MVKSISLSESAEWCERAGVKAGRFAPQFEFSQKHSFKLPSDAGERVQRCKVLWKSLMPSGTAEVMVWTSDRHVWESGEHTPIVDRWVTSLGRGARIDDFPSVVCDGSSEEDGLSLVILSALFLWDVWILNPELSRIAKLSHDEVGFLGEIASSADDWMAEFLQLFGT